MKTKTNMGVKNMSIKKYFESITYTHNYAFEVFYIIFKIHLSIYQSINLSISFYLYTFRQL